MKNGFIKVAAATPDIKVCDCFFNSENIIKNIFEAYEKNCTLIVFPELCITGYTCSDLFLQTALLNDAKIVLKNILEKTNNLNIISIIGMPLEYNNKLYNCGVCIYKGKILGAITKNFIPNYNEFYEKRHFNTLEKGGIINLFENISFPIENSLIFNVSNIPNFKFSMEICEDLWAINCPSNFAATKGASIIANLSASNEIVGKGNYRKDLIKIQSAKCICGYIYSSAGQGESTTDLVFSGHNMIFENGKCLAEAKKFENGIIYSEIDLQYINNERRKNTSFFDINKNIEIKEISFEIEPTNIDIERYIEKLPFVPNNEKEIEKRCNEILDIQAYSLKKRIEHIGIKNVVVGISGGLDSTQALIVINRTFEILKYDKKNIICVTMPCFGTTDRTYNNAKKLCEKLGVTLLEINIKEAVLKHFEDINHDINIKNVTYENSQARERTQILMDIANKYNGIVIGTGDLSELALGFATYNGDHMSMYGVNCSIPKTLIKYLVKYFAISSSEDLKNILLDILETPVSPELLPPENNGNIAQITEDIVGPYELHDFFLYHMIRNNFEPEKIYYLAKKAFKNIYDDKTIIKWLEKFYFRFFTQQFKRSCLPDGAKVGSVSLSPRGDFRMPSDASFESFLNRIKNLK